MTKRGYFVKECEDAEHGYAIVANSSKEAEQILWNHSEKLGEEEWERTNLVAEIKPQSKVEHLPIGLIEDLRTGLVCGIFAYIENFECDVCGCDDGNFVKFVGGKVMCEECEEMYEKEKL